MKTEQLAAILTLINDKQDKGAARVLIAIDGAGGAGKSTLARQIKKKRSDAAIIGMDDFYRPEEASIRRTWTSQQGYQNFFDWKRLQDQVLRPLQSGCSPAYQVYDWITNKLNGWKDVALSPIMIVEGVYTIRPELRPFYHISLLVETPKDVCLNRLRSRTDKEGDIQMWRAAEDWYFANIEPQKNCDLIISGW
jgi:uridine kinase